MDKHLAIKARDVDFNQEVLKHIRSLGYCISNPNQKKGDFIDVIPEGKICGFDMIAYESLRNAWRTVVTTDLDEIKTEINQFINDSVDRQSENSFVK